MIPVFSSQSGNNKKVNSSVQPLYVTEGRDGANATRTNFLHLKISFLDVVCVNQSIYILLYTAYYQHTI